MKTRYRIGLTLVGFVFVLSTILVFQESTTSFAQQPNFPPPNRKPACSCFCGDATFDSFNIFDKADIAAGKCYGGPLGIRACGEALRELPGDQLRALCQQAKAKGKVCPALAPVCDEAPPESGCEKPTPWFDNSTDCTDAQEPQIRVSPGRVDLSICGFPVYRWAEKDPLALEAYASVLKGWVVSSIGSRVCCNKIQEAAKSGKPCDPSVDIDCDGVLNPADLNTTYLTGAPVPQIDLYTTPPGAKIDEFPNGLNPDDPDFMPNRTARGSKGVGECACKWELIKGELKCSPDGKQRHVYVATWRCPVTKVEVFTTKYAPASAPCSAPKRTGMFEYFDRPTDFLAFGTVSLRSTRCG